MSRCQTSSFNREISSTLAWVDSTCLEIRSWLEDNDLGRMAFAVELTARECLNNAILHGNREEVAGKINLSMALGRKWLCLQVADEGPGFDWRRAANRGIPDANATSGRGLCIAQMHAQRVQFNRTGNKITLWFQIHKK